MTTDDSSRRLLCRLLVIGVYLIVVPGCGSTAEEGNGTDAASPAVVGDTEEPNTQQDAEAELSADQASPQSSDDGGETAVAELSEDFYTVAAYDLEADPAVQLQETLKRAKLENKTVLLQVGGDWCGWCKLMSKFFASNTKINELLNRGFLVQKVTFAQENRNEAFLSEYPPINGYPFLFVLDADGKMLHSQNTAWLEAPAKDGKGYSEEKLSTFLERWIP